jgi:hypothetical protein
MDSVLSDAAVVVAGKEQFSCPLGDDTIILDVKGGLYFSLDNVGALVWQLIQSPKTVTELRAAILEIYDVAPDVCERDLAALLGELAARNLIEITDAAAA